MTTLPLSSVLNDLEFDIACEHRDCDNAALVMVKGCSDSRHYAICGHCLADSRRHFESQIMSTCAGCGVFWVRFDDHFNLIYL